MKRMNEIVLRLTILLGLVVSVVTGILFGYQGVIGVWIGVIMALIGYRMIVNMALTLDDSDPQAKGRTNYMMRNGLYALVMVIAYFAGIPLLAVVAGYLAHKASLLMYTVLERRHDNE